MFQWFIKYMYLSVFSKSPNKRASVPSAFVYHEIIEDRGAGGKDFSHLIKNDCHHQIYCCQSHQSIITIMIIITLPHQAGIELSDFHARGWKSDQGGRNSMQEMHGNQTKCMEFQPIKKSSNFWTSILCPGINFSCSKSLWIWWTIDPLILACLKLMTYASFSTKELLAVLMDGNPCTNGWNSMHQNRKNVIASCFFEQSCLRQVKIQDPWQT